MPRFLDEISYYDSSGTLQTVEPSEPVYCHYVQCYWMSELNSVIYNWFSVVLVCNYANEINTFARLRAALETFPTVPELTNNWGTTSPIIPASGTVLKQTTAASGSMYQVYGVGYKDIYTVNLMVVSFNATSQRVSLTSSDDFELDSSTNDTIEVADSFITFN